jgi:expansin (peptidoglycan-binding protein)
VLVAFMLAACDAAGPAEPTVIVDGNIEGAATVTWVEIEGGAFVLAATNGAIYQPMNLPGAFRDDGLAVRFAGTLRPDVDTFLMMGVPVELTRIERR